MNPRLMAAAVLLVFGLIQSATAVVLLNDEQAFAKMFPDVDEVTTEEVTLDANRIASVKEQLGGKWTLYQAGGAKAEDEEEGTISLHYGIVAGEKVGVALIEVQPGKWGPVKYIIALGADGSVRDLAVMMYVEKRGRPIALRRFLGQFIGKSSEDPILMGKDVQAISGATISCRATAFAVKKVIAIYGAVFPADEGS